MFFIGGRNQFYTQYCKYQTLSCLYTKKIGIQMLGNPEIEYIIIGSQSIILYLEVIIMYYVLHVRWENTHYFHKMIYYLLCLLSFSIVPILLLIFIHHQIVILNFNLCLYYHPVCLLIYFDLKALSYSEQNLH